MTRVSAPRLGRRSRAPVPRRRRRPEPAAARSTLSPIIDPRFAQEVAHTRVCRRTAWSDNDTWSKCHKRQPPHDAWLGATPHRWLWIGGSGLAWNAGSTGVLLSMTPASSGCIRSDRTGIDKALYAGGECRLGKHARRIYITIDIVLPLLPAFGKMINGGYAVDSRARAFRISVGTANNSTFCPSRSSPAARLIAGQYANSVVLSTNVLSRGDL